MICLYVTSVWLLLTEAAVSVLVQLMSVHAVPALRIEQWEAYHCGRRFQAFGKCDVQLQGLWPVNGEGPACSLAFLCCSIAMRLLLGKLVQTLPLVAQRVHSGAEAG